MTDYEDNFTFQEIHRRLANDAETVIRMLIPTGKKHGYEWVAGNIHGDKGDSLKINLRNGIWADFATGEKGDLVELWGKTKGIGKAAAKREAMAYLGIHKEESEHDTGERYVPYKDGHLAGEWTYRRADGSVWCIVYRFNNPSKPGTKDFIPWDPIAGKYKRPDGIAPLYGLVAAALAATDTIIVVEGEGKVDRLAKVGFTAVCSIGGARAAGKTDWSVLRGRSCIIWRDNDTAGKSFEDDVFIRLKENGAASIKRIDIPAGKPDKWDCKDASDDEVREILAKIELAPAEHVGRRSLRLDEWKSDSYQGEPEKQAWLVESVIPLSKVTVLCAAGDAGKGLLTLDLGLKVVRGETDLVFPTMAFGQKVVDFGSAVILAAEDDKAEMHRRIEALDPLKKRFHASNSLYVVPLPNLGGPQILYRSTRSGSGETTPEYEAIRLQLRAIPDLKLVVVDPISTFFAVDMNDQTGSYSAMMAMQALATEFNCAMVLVHHVAKGNPQHPIRTPQEARNHVKGSGAFVDAARCVYSLWAEEDKEAKTISNMLGEKYERNRIFKGAVVKSNARADMTIRTYLRNTKTGLLEDKTPDLQRIRDNDRVIRTALMEWVGDLQEAGEPLCYPNDPRLTNPMSLPTSLQQAGDFNMKRLLNEFTGKRQLVVQNEMMGRKLDFYAIPGKRFAESVKPAVSKFSEEL